MVDMVPRGDDLKRGVVKGVEPGRTPFLFLYTPKLHFVSPAMWPRVMGAASSKRNFFVHPSVEYS